MIGAPGNGRGAAVLGCGTKINLLQINLNHCWAAQQLLAQTAAELTTDIVLVADPHRIPADDVCWSGNPDSRCAVFTTRGSGLVPQEKGVGKGFAWMLVDGILVYSCYCTPAWSDQEFSFFLDALETSINLRGRTGAVLVVGGDFNAHSAEWGSSTEDPRGGLLSDFAASMGLTTLELSLPTEGSMRSLWWM